MFGLDTLRNTKAGSKILRRGSDSSASSSSNASSSSSRNHVNDSAPQVKNGSGRKMKQTSNSGKSHRHHKNGNRKQRFVGSFLTNWAQDESFLHEYANNAMFWGGPTPNMATPIYGNFGMPPY